MKIKLLLFFALSLISAFTNATAQQPISDEATLIGTIYDANGEAIPNATVALYDSAAINLISGTTSRADGSFSLKTHPGRYTIKISFLSYQTHEQTLTLSAGETVSLGEITLAESTEILGEVEVRAERSTMEMDFDSRTFNVGQDIVSMGGSALDVLDNVPSITTDYEGNVSLRGSQGVQILINGRPSSLIRSGTDALSAIPSSMIERVEVITNPSARYSAEGTAGIINIVLRDNAQLGFNGTISANTGHPQSHEIGANLNYHKNNINWFLSTDIEYDSRPRSGEVYQLFGSPDTTYIYNQISDSRNYEVEGSLRLGADMYLPDDQMLTVSSRINLEGGEDKEKVVYTDYAIDEPLRQQLINNNIGELIIPDGIDQRLTRNDREKAREQDFDFSLQYENRFRGNENHRLTADANLSFGREREHSTLMQSTEFGSTILPDQRTETKEKYRDLRLDVDYERPVGENARFEAGYRTNIEWMDNTFLVEEELINGTWQPLLNFNDNFTYYENVNSLYSTYSGKAGLFTYQLGLRAEQTIIKTELKDTGEGSDQSYLNLFPSAFLSYQMDEQNSFQFSYSRRIRRPWSRMLLPFSGYSDSRNIFRGNPNLKPEFGNSYEAGYLRYWGSGSLLTSVYYRHRTEVFERITTIGEDGVSYRFPINLSTEDAWGVEFTADQRILKDLQLLGSLNLFQSSSKGVYGNQVLKSDAGAFFSRIRARWKFLDGWNYQASFFYRGPRQTTQGRRAAQSFMSSAIAKELFNGKATLSLNVRDLFNSRRHDETINELYSYSVRNFSWSSRSFSLNFRYRFSQTSSS